MKSCPLCDTPYANHHTNCEKDGALLIETRELDPGTVIRGKYRIVRLLGRGGMGKVYLAEHILLGRPRALKFISSELSQDPWFLKRFRTEAQAAIELRHPNVVEVADLDQAEDGSPYIAMEYVNGSALRGALGEGPFSVYRALRIARGVAEGLSAAHARGIIHRDVKPDNILLAAGKDGRETPKLLDFGIAAIKENATAISRTRGLILTPEYAAPEQWRGMAAEELDGRADLYALGGVLYEMLTGETCYHAHNVEGWMYQHLHGEPRTPSRLRQELATWPGLDALVLRLLAREREGRFHSAAALLEALAGLQPASVSAAGADAPPTIPPSDAVEVRSTRRDTDAPEPTPTPRYSEPVEPRSTPRYPIAPEAVSTPRNPDQIEPRSTPRHPDPIEAAPAPRYQEPVEARSTPRYPVAPEAVSTPPYSEPIEARSTPRNPDPVEARPTPRYQEPVEARPTPRYPDPIEARPTNFQEPAAVSSRIPAWKWAVPAGAILAGVGIWLAVVLLRPAPVASVPVLSPSGGTYAEARAVAISDTTPGAVIHYTLDGNPPTPDSAIYTLPITSLASGTVVRAMATAKGYQPSRGVTQVYIWGAPVLPGPNPYDQGVDAYGHKQYAQARTFFSQACDIGDQKGCNKLGLLYAQGLGGAVDAQEAGEIFKNACERGNLDSCASRGVLYQEAGNSQEARKYFQKACDGGSDGGCKLLHEMQ